MRKLFNEDFFGDGLPGTNLVSADLKIGTVAFSAQSPSPLLLAAPNAVVAESTAALTFGYVSYEMANNQGLSDDKEDTTYIQYDGPISALLSIPNDPMYAQQWHLDNPNASLFDLNIVAANGVDSLWDDYTGTGISVFVIDNAFDYLHEDLAANYNTALDFDFENTDLDPFGLGTESHGTAVMGIISAVGDNGIGVTGIAYNSTAVGYQTNGFINDDWLQDIRDAIAAAPNGGADVINISQGIANDANSEFGNGYNAVRFTEIDTSINDTVTNGRGGLGTSIIKSGGNSRSDFYDVNSDPWTNNTQQIVVAAVDQNGFISSYSSYGAPTLVSAFGTPGQVVTTDRTGADGYNGTNYTSTFNGTSAAAPEVAGVVALMLDAETGLGWRDVQTILAYSARHVGSVVDGSTTAGSERTPWDWNAATDWNGGGLHYSNDYGYGLVDAHAAVRLAESWLVMDAAQTSANEITTFEDDVNATFIIPDGNVVGSSFAITETESIIVERVTIELAFSTTYLADMEIYITSPNGVEHVLIQDQAGGADFDGRYTFETQAFRGENSAGTWTVRIVDDAGGDVLTVTDLDFRTFGHTATNDDRFIFTEEFSDYAGVDGHVTNFAGGAGDDWINAAAVISDTVIDLRAGTGTIDGVAITMTGIENVYTGDGNDTVTIHATNANNVNLGRGDDVLFIPLEGVSGGQVFDGGAGIDTFDFTQHLPNVDFRVDLSLGEFDLLVGGFLTTILNFENVFAGSGDDVIMGSGGDNILNGGGGDDIIRGNNNNIADADQIFGGAGNDNIGFSAGSLTPGNLFDGGAGNDTFFFGDFGGSYDVNLASGVFDAVSGGGFMNTLIDLENIIAGGGNDILTGTAGANTFNGGGGNDQMNGGGGNDRLFGEDGNDTLDGGDGNDLLSGGAGDDIFIGGAGNDNHLGSGGFDTMDYSASASRVVLNLITGGTLGDAAGDSYNSIESVIGSAFNDDITGGSASDTIFGGDGNDRLFGSGGFDVLYGGAGDDLLAGGDDADTFIGGAGADVHLGGGGLDIIDYSASTSRVVLNLDTSGTVGDAAGDTYFGVETVIGTDFNDNITGDSASETLDGGAGNDVLVGAGGYDLLIGGDGDDTMSGGVGHDRFLGGAGADSHNGGANIDTVDYRLATSSVTLNLSTNGSLGDALGDTYVNIERVLGSDFNDSIFGSTGNDNLHGYAGDDGMWGGSSGNDVLFGEAGNDTFFYGTVTGEGFDTIADFVTGAGSDDVISLYQGNADFDTFAEVMAVATQVGTSVVFSFGGSNKVRVLNTMIADFHADDFVLSAPGNGEDVAEAPSFTLPQETAVEALEAIAVPEVEPDSISDDMAYQMDMAGFDMLDALLH